MKNLPNWKLLVGAALVAVIVGCASSPPMELVQRNDQAGLVTWYQHEARELRRMAEEMRQMATYYEKYTPKQGKKSILVQHCNNLVDKYTKAAEESEALAKLHAEQGKKLARM